MKEKCNRVEKTLIGFFIGYNTWYITSTVLICRRNLHKKIHDETFFLYILFQLNALIKGNLNLHIIIKLKRNKNIIRKGHFVIIYFLLFKVQMWGGGINLTI